MKGLDRIIWRINNGWKANEKDQEAINEIITYVNKTNERALNDNEIAFKMYVMLFSQYLERYEATVFDDIPQKELHKMLTIPTERFLERFTERLNKSERYTLMEQKGINKHPALMSDDEKEKELYIVDKMTNLEKQKFNDSYWNADQVKEQLVKQFNKFLNFVR